MTITTYAAVKDFFEKEFMWEQGAATIGVLQAQLIERNPSAADILHNSRFAVNNTFVDNDYQLQPNDHIHIIPPSSGG